MRPSRPTSLVPGVVRLPVPPASGLLALGLVALLTQACAPNAPVSSVASTTERPTRSQSAAPTEAPSPTDLGGLPTTAIELVPGSAPVDVEHAFGSIWVANHRTNDVSRIDPETMEETARIAVDDGPGWFVVTADAVWVSSQMRRGLTRIDPTTHETVQAGYWPSCHQGVFAFGAIWQSACDAGYIMRIDPTTLELEDITADGHHWLTLAGEDLVALGPDGLARLDPGSRTIEQLGPCCKGRFTRILGFDGESLWIASGDGVQRVDPRTLETVATLTIEKPDVMAVAGGSVWITEEFVGVHQVDLATSEIVSTIPVPAPTSITVADDALWVTSFEGNSLWRFELPRS